MRAKSLRIDARGAHVVENDTYRPWHVYPNHVR
jgi:hypothetical protein